MFRYVYCYWYTRARGRRRDEECCDESSCKVLRMNLCDASLVQQHSRRAACTPNVSYGCVVSLSIPTVWVDHGCRGLFSVRLASSQSDTAQQEQLVACGRGGQTSRRESCKPGDIWAPSASVGNATTFVLHNACVGLLPHAPGRVRLMQFIGNIVVPRTFPSFHGQEGSRIQSPSRPPTAAEVAELRSWPRRWSHRLGVVLEQSMDNLFHTFFHAVPTVAWLPREAQLPGGAASLASAEFLPRYTLYWPVEASSHGSSFGISTGPPLVWPALEIYVRALLGLSHLTRAGLMAAGAAAAAHADPMPASAWTEAAEQIHRFLHLQPRTLHCYKVLVGGHPHWWPATAAGYEEAHRLVSTFRTATLATLAHSSFAASAYVGRGRPSASSSPLPILFELRTTGRRVITNAEQLRARVGRWCPQCVRFVSLSALPIHAQLERVREAAGLAGVHGQALAYVAFLPSDRRPCAMLEIQMMAMARATTSARGDYPRLAALSGVRYFRLDKQADAPECTGQFFRECGNVTVELPAVMRVLKLMAAHVGHDPRGESDLAPANVKPASNERTSQR